MNGSLTSDDGENGFAYLHIFKTFNEATVDSWLWKMPACVAAHLLLPLRVCTVRTRGHACVCASVVINILNHFNYKKGKITLVGQKQLREL